MKKLFLTHFLLSIVSCNDIQSKQKIQISDTLKVIEFALRHALQNENLPSSSRLKEKYKYGDSILFTSQTLSLSFLPRNIDSIKFKILTSNDICSEILSDSKKR